MAEERILLVRDVMTREVVTITPDEPVIEAARKMKQYEIGSVVVVSQRGEVIGIITERDLVTRVVAENRDPLKTTVREVMTPNPITVYDDTPLEIAARLMSERGVGHLPVVDKAGRLVGIIAKSDLIEFTPELIEILYLKKGSEREILEGGSE
ncbi:putative signal transduction protein with CBS domains [Pyrolobus fumarii 1A]|uniref:Putative signal transduction protein with CBS domains n=1 Tax=Pyrolobus fumarii (strain DSM 11204 / 1A) TaxID=694429 RepID=G0ECT5_PYRF1|nr:CBS domain-containing protein [Pyrolobus fumarii]AEM39655.1 putative signal transduction protein with CBS domains [Pyrolobus fumarii 1A]